MLMITSFTSIASKGYVGEKRAEGESFLCVRRKCGVLIKKEDGETTGN